MDHSQPGSIIQAEHTIHAMIHGKLRLPVMKENKASTRKIRNRILAMLAADPAMPLKPSTAATSAMTKKVTE